MSHSIAKPKKTIYLDHAATTPIDTCVRAIMQTHVETAYGNPSSFHHKGREAYDVLEKSRQMIAQLLTVSAREIIFTGSGTESDNLAILGIARANRSIGNHVIVSQIEHKAVLASAHQLKQEGFEVTYVPVDAYGSIRMTDLQRALRKDTILVSIMHANNEIGTIEPIQDIAKLLHDHYSHSRRPLFHTDACQTAGLLSVNPRKLGVDALTINGSKIYGPKGVGILYLSSGTPILPLVLGGSQEHNLRAGTENVAAIAGFAEALKNAMFNAEKHAKQLRILQNQFVQVLKKEIPDIIFNGHPTKRLPNNVHVCIPDIEGESLVLKLDQYGICCSTGSACSSQDLSPSHVLQAIGRNDTIIHGSLRFSYGKDTTWEDLAYTAKILAQVTKELRCLTASTVSIMR